MTLSGLPADPGTPTMNAAETAINVHVKRVWRAAVVRVNGTASLSRSPARAFERHSDEVAARASLCDENLGRLLG
jgi:hypothetical protein